MKRETKHFSQLGEKKKKNKEKRCCASWDACKNLDENLRYVCEEQLLPLGANRWSQQRATTASWAIVCELSYNTWAHTNSQPAPRTKLVFSPQDMQQQACPQPDTRLTPDLWARNEPSLTWEYRVRACALRRAHLSTSPGSLRYLTDFCKKKQNRITSEVSQPCHLPTRGSVCPQHRVPIYFPLNSLLKINKTRT